MEQLVQEVEEKGYGKDNPFEAKLVERRRLTHELSEKETWHCVVDVSGIGVKYEVGDCLGVYPTNDPGAVDELLGALGFRGEEEVDLSGKGGVMTLREALWGKLSINKVTKKLLEWMKGRIGDEREGMKLEGVLEGWELIDVAEVVGSAEFGAQEYVEQLPKMMSRYYSIASSSRVYPEEIHLTVAMVRYEANNRRRVGVASSYLGERAVVGEERVRAFVVSSHFKLPEDESRDVIMVGPGTGIAPFRGFMQEHVALGRSGRTWLFFGEQREEYDYLYGAEWEKYYEDKYLTRKDTAFSRDQEHKIYVQDKMEERGKELWEWLEGGAYFYVCGDAKNMAKDVEHSLQEIIGEEGKMTSEEAKTYVKGLKREKRYQKDIY